MKKSKEQQNDIYAGLYFKILYIQVRKFKEINDDLIDSSTVIDEVLDLYEGFGVDEVYQADTGKFPSEKAPY